MKGFFIGANVVSELTKRVPDIRVPAFLAEHDEL